MECRNKIRVLGMAFAALLACTAEVGSAAELKLSAADGEVAFEATGRPSALRIRGTTHSLDGTLKATAAGLSGDLTVDLDTLDTGLKMRNEHMKNKYLETPRFPKAQLHIGKVGELKQGAKLVTGLLPFEGTLKLHGVEKPVTGTVELKAIRADSAVPFVATFTISIKDFGINTPSFAGITVTDTVSVKVDALARGVAGAESAL